MEHKLPEGYTARPVTMDEAETVADLLNTILLNMIGTKEFIAEELQYEWQAKNFDLEKDTRVVFNPAGKMVGYVDVMATMPVPVRPFVWGGVHPEYEGLGLGTAMVEWALQRAHHVIDKVPADLRVSVLTWMPGDYQPAIDLLTDHGFKHDRYFFIMRIDMETAPPEPQWPEGFVVRPIRFPEEVEDFYRTYDDSFKDHYGHIDQPFEEAFENFKHQNTNSPMFAPELWLGVWDGDEMAAILLGRKESEEDPTCGYVHLLGVRRAYRKRGLGLALLQHIFNIYWQRGKKGALLDVDASSLTGAVGLYERAGMSVQRRASTYEVELRPGKNLSVKELQTETEDQPEA